MTQSHQLSQQIKRINDALALHQSGRIREAQEIYQQVLQAVQHSLEANPLAGLIHNSLGLALHHQGLFLEAVAHYQKAILLRPDLVDVCFNLGNSQRALGNLDAAIANFRQTLANSPDNVDAHICLGLAFQEQGKHIEAVESYQNALAIRPDLAAVHNNLGTAFQHLLRFENAAASYRQAVTIQPTYIDAHCNLGRLLKQFGKPEQAILCFQEVLKIDPQSGIAHHEIATLRGSAPERAPDDYIVSVFDEYAEKFDAHLQEHLDYMVPQKIASLVVAHRNRASPKMDALDLGCGTGLAGAAIAPLCKQLVGVDLSANMLHKANERNIYQRLVRSDLLSMMKLEAAASYDLILAADVFVYVGKLDDIIQEAKRLLRPSGMIAFSVKALEPSGSANAVGARGDDASPDFELMPSGRYRHAKKYLAALSQMNNFSVLEQELTQFRMEKNKPVNGYLLLWVR